MNQQFDRATLALTMTRHQFEEGEAVDFLNLLDRNRNRLSSRPHDKIYGLLGLAPPSVQEAIYPDYRLDIATVYGQPLVAYWKNVSCLRPLLSARKVTNSRLPSWIPDWSIDFHLGKHMAQIARYMVFNACGLRYVSPTVHDQRVLHVGGFKCDNVKTLGAIDVEAFERGTYYRPSTFNVLVNLARWLPRTNAAPSNPSQPHAFWRTVILDCKAQKMDTKRRPSERASEDDYNAIREEAAAHDIEKLDRRSASAEILKYAANIMTHARFTITSSGFMGMVPLDTEVGDEIYILEGGRMPFVLRRSEEIFSVQGSSEAGKPCYTLVGECYLDGFMDGELSDKLRDEAVDVFIV